VTEDELKDFCSQRMAKFKVPQYYEFQTEEFLTHGQEPILVATSLPLRWALGGSRGRSRVLDDSSRVSGVGRAQSRLGRGSGVPFSWGPRNTWS
jgi:hypothetical protein